MKRGRPNKGRHKKTALAATPCTSLQQQPPQGEFRKSVQPLVVICHSDWTNRHSECLCSKSNQWSVLVYNPDTNKWWDRLQTSSRVRHGPPTTGATTCHAIVVHDGFSNGDDNTRNLPQKALKFLGEGMEIATVALLGPTPDGIQEELEEALAPQRIRMWPQSSLLSSNYQELRSLWTFQDAHENIEPIADLPIPRQVEQVCQHWSSLSWRWKGRQLVDLYRYLRQPRRGEPQIMDGQDQNAKKDETEKESKEETLNNEYKNDKNSTKHGAKNSQSLVEMALQHYPLRRKTERKLALLLENPDTQRVADLILTQGVATRQGDPNLFGRVHAAACSAALRLGIVAEYLIVGSTLSSKAKNGDTTTCTLLNAYQYATASQCTPALEQLKIVPCQDVPSNKFCLPLLIGNARMITVTLLPALFPTGVQDDSTMMMSTTANNAAFDCVLGSRRIWPEHVALKAAILYIFQGSPGAVWDLMLDVVKSALPRTWEILWRDEVPDENFLRALFHPDVLEAGRLERHPPGNGGTAIPSLSSTTDNSQRSIPWHFLVLSRLYALSRFVRTLDKPDMQIKDPTVCQAVASTLKVHVKQVEAIVQEANKSSSSSTLSARTCEKILRMQLGDQSYKSMRAAGDGTKMTPDAMEVLGMLGLFLSRDRKSLTDANRIEPLYGDGANNLDDVQELQQKYTTTMALADCAMFCGAIKWLSEDDEGEEGIWTCLHCLHRWQRRGHVREALQTRKLMHPMTLTPFTRQEYYNPLEWDHIQEVTNGNISLLGVEFYWGPCSTEGCGRLCPAVARSGACAEMDGIPLNDFPATVVLNTDDDSGQRETIPLRRSLEVLGRLGVNRTVTSTSLELYFDSEEKLLYLPGPVRRRVRNCIDKSTYILPRGILCDKCGAVPDDAIDEYCPYCGTGFEPIFACIHYTCPHCRTHFCKACLGIQGMHFNNIYSATDHVCWRLLGNRYSYHNKGYCGCCRKERPWPASHKLVLAGHEIRKEALSNRREMPLSTAIQMQASNLRVFTNHYDAAVKIFENCTHTIDLGKNYCHCGPTSGAANYDDI